MKKKKFKYDMKKFAGRKFISFDEVYQEALKDPEVRKYDESLYLDFKYKVIELMIRFRNAAGLNQKEMAKRMKTTQSVIARIENSDTMPSMKTIEKYAKVVGMRPVISFEPIRE